MMNLNPVAKLQHDLKGQLRRQEIIFQLIFRSLRLEAPRALPTTKVEAPKLNALEMQELISEMEKTQTSFNLQWLELKKILTDSTRGPEELP